VLPEVPQFYVSNTLKQNPTDHLQTSETHQSCIADMASQTSKRDVRPRYRPLQRKMSLTTVARSVSSTPAAHDERQPGSNELKSQTRSSDVVPSSEAPSILSAFNAGCAKWSQTRVELDGTPFSFINVVLQNLQSAAEVDVGGGPVLACQLRPTRVNFA
jgi:hypothetical protein